MHDVRKVNVMENIMDENDHIASHVKEHLSDLGLFVINQMGAPGVGKTTTLKNIIKNLKDHTPYVIEGDIESDLDTQDLRKLGIKTFQINTFGACHLDAPLIHNAIKNMDFAAGKPGILFIENIGNLVCPAEFSIGEHIKMLISTVTEGSDKPYKYPLAFENADVIILNKVDLLPYVDFDEDFFMKGLRALNKEVPVFKVSGKTGEGFPEVAAWLEEVAARTRIHYLAHGKAHCHCHGEDCHDHDHDHDHGDFSHSNR